jgi:hypothetical protein
MCSNDAKSCYDRSPFCGESLCMRRMGWKHHRLCACLQRFKPASFDSNSLYSRLATTGQLWTVPIQGVGQGKGRPQIWAVVSTPFSTCYGTKGTGLTFGRRSPVLLSASYAFVDDTDLIITSQNPDDTADVASSNAASPGLMGRRHSSYRRRNCPGKVIGIDFKWQQGNWRYVTG